MLIGIGYPRNSSYHDDTIERIATRDRIFTYYNHKMVSPGKIIPFQIVPNDQFKISSQNSFLHDTTLIKGNSGSPIIDPENGKVIGMHCGGIYRKYNHALKSKTILKILEKISN